MTVQENLSALNQQMLDEPKSPVGVFELPCGHLDPDGILHSEAEVKEITANEEDLLASDKLAAEKKISELLIRCVTRIGKFGSESMRSVLSDLTIGDRTYLMFAIRRVSLGNIYPFVDKCPNCENEQLFMLDLSELEVKQMSDPMKRQYDVVTPTGKKIRWHIMTGRDEEFAGKYGKSGMDAVSLSALARVDSIDGREVVKTPVAGKPKDLSLVKSLALRDLTALQDDFNEREGGVETSMDMTCPNCQHEFKRDLDVGQTGFFFPSRALKDWKKRSST